ncbi:hypothetical protein Bra3105_07500 [Brachybacterium halotolerans subsp. kimchii]|uniref:hypothetical protein n=1 Tax=Brachybacterium halotolerans TaxID=2795215 RepID=UPI001E4BCD22|nr:hypothetical protein [Brachybacterium halotolerans]UEJ84142.1 hypothetical protein Bra3105_07500 [Brachybacterium halotolerans subsp. kimchii]
MTGGPLTTEHVPSGPAEARSRVHEILSVVVDALRTHAAPHAGAPALELIEHKPRRDRASGTRYLGVRTIQHVSALIGSTAAPPASPSPASLLRVADRALRGVGLAMSEDGEVSGVRTRVWEGPEGDRAEVVVGARLLLRVISAPFLPGVEQGDVSTTPSAVRRVLRPAPSPHAVPAALPMPAVAPAGMTISAPTPESSVLTEN